MSNRPTRAVAFVLVLLFASMSPLAMQVSAHQSILLSTDTSHVVLIGGESGNVTLTIGNNATAIESFNVTVDTSGLSSVWQVIPSESTVENVFPTWSKNTTIVVRLSEGALSTDSGSFDIHVTEPDQNFSSSITIYVSVAPTYNPSLDLSPMGGPLTSIEAGSNTTYSIGVENLGSVEDTLLLDVEYEPDLAAWWANYTNGSSNNSGNNTGNNTGGNGTGNGTGGNGTGTGNGTGGNGTGTGNGTGGNGTGTGNGTGNGTGSNTTLTVDNVLMFGNSYTFFNSLGTMVEAMGVTNADVVAAGGNDLADHWANVNFSGSNSNTTLRDPNIDWDFVVLQDQSQIPSLPTNDTNWQASKNGSVHLATEIEVEGGDSVLFMTWGRRSGESPGQWHQYNNINQNFTDMQNRLADGYYHYAENMSAAGNTVWIAPVGLAFEHIHDYIVAGGVDPTASGNTFYNLYDADGSHPSASGSYLAACVLYATMTGNSPVGSNDTVSLSAALKLELQQAAAATVFNETSHIDYPWESSPSTSSMMMSSPRGLGGGIPSGWNVHWANDEYSNMPAGSSQIANLHISVPSNAAPDYYGFRLFSASTGGNVSTSTLLVVHINEDHQLSVAFLGQNDEFTPGLATDSSIQVTNTGNAMVDYDWELSVEDGPCEVMLATATSSLAPNDVVDVDFQLSVHEEATKSENCDLKFEGTGSSNSEQHSAEPYLFTIDVDELVEFELVGPSSNLEVSPGTPVEYEMRILNNGSETVTFYLDVLSTSGLTTTISSGSGVTVAPGESGLWSLNTDANSGQSGSLMQMFSVSYSDVSSTAAIDIEILGVSQATISGPLDGRIQVRPGQSVTTNFTLENTGTTTLSLNAALLGLPAEVEATLSNDSVALNVGELREVQLTLTVSTSASASTNEITFGYMDSEVSAHLTLSLQVQERIAVLLGSTSTRVVAGPSTDAVFTFDATNLGTTTDTLYVSLVDNGASDWFEFELSATSLLLESGESMPVTLNVREISSGAPSNGVAVAVQLRSSSDDSIFTQLNLTVEALVAGAEIVVLSDDDSAPPSGVIHGTVVVTNSGSGSDQLLLSTVGIDCGVSTVLSLGAGESSTALPWSCILPEDAEAGLKELRFRVTSSSRTSFSDSSVEIYTVEPVWGDSGVLQLAFDEASLSVPSSGGSSMVLTVTNLANAQVTGTLSLDGIGDGLMVSEWTRLSDNSTTNQMTLSPGSSMQFTLSLTSLVSTNEEATLRARATYLIGDTTSSETSGDVVVRIIGPELPPNGIQLPFDVALSQSDSLNAMLGGWGLSLLILSVLYLRRGKKDSVLSAEEDLSEYDEAEVVEEESAELGYNECRLEGDKVSCPSCDARLGVPRGSEPPFRFTCPKCSTLIRVIE